MPSVHLRYHAFLREKVGRAEETLEVKAEQSTVSGVLAAFAGKYPLLRGFSASLHAAVNDEFAGRDAPVAAGDRVDLLPPFGGG